MELSEQIRIMEIILNAILCAVAILVMSGLFCRIQCKWYIRQLNKVNIGPRNPYLRGMKTGLLGRLEVFDPQCLPAVRRLIKDAQKSQLNEERKDSLKADK